MNLEGQDGQAAAGRDADGQAAGQESGAGRTPAARVEGATGGAQRAGEARSERQLLEGAEAELLHALILCDGEPPTAERFFRHWERADLFIVTDGAVRAASALEAPPDVVVGDLDSFDPSLFPQVEVVKDPDQETNDLEKALALALERGAHSAVILGATGRRLDHTLKNLCALRRFQGRLTLWMEDEYARMELVSGSLEVEGEPGQPLSLFPLSGRVEGIVTEGLAYPLQDEWLENGLRDGSSNAFVGTRARIRVREGVLLVLIGHPRSDLEERHLEPVV